MEKDYSKQNLRKASFKGASLSQAHFADSDLRGADFSEADLSGANFSRIKTGITPMAATWIFLGALLISALSGYVAMLAGRTVQYMLASKDPRILTAGYISIALTLLFILYSYWRGVGHAIRNLLIPAGSVAILLGIAAYYSGLGTGRGMLYTALALFLVAVMFIVGTIARAAAGSLSNILFLLVAVSGSMVGKNLGGGIGTIVMAVACALISKKALKGTRGFESLQQVASYITSRFGTSFRKTRLSKADFTGTNMRNCDFTDADVTDVSWSEKKKVNCMPGDK
jgi:hypothetical protein